MAEPTRISPVFRPGSEFDAFLFAPLRENANGMPTSVISGLAQLDLDPWHEAAALAQLSKAAAITRLTALIAALPGQAAAEASAPANLDGLVALLPRPAVLSRVQSPQMAARLGQVSRPRAATYLVLALVIVVLGTQFIMAKSRQSTPDDGARGPATGISTPPATPPGPKAASG